jgi:hypothetical protein
MIITVTFDSNDYSEELKLPESVQGEIKKISPIEGLDGETVMLIFEIVKDSLAALASIVAIANFIYKITKDKNNAKASVCGIPVSEPITAEDIEKRIRIALEDDLK